MLGTRLWHAFTDDIVAEQAEFEKKLDALARELGTRGKAASSAAVAGMVAPSAPIPTPAKLPSVTAKPVPAVVNASSASPQIPASAAPPAATAGADHDLALIVSRMTALHAAGQLTMEEVAQMTDLLSDLDEQVLNAEAQPHPNPNLDSNPHPIRRPKWLKPEPKGTEQRKVLQRPFVGLARMAPC